MKYCFIVMFCFACISGAIADPIVLEEIVESSAEQIEAQKLRDGRDAPKSLLGDIGASMAEAAQNPVTWPLCDYFGDDYRRDTCFEVIAERDNKVDFRCTKGVGSQFASLTRTLMLCKNGWKSEQVVLGCTASGSGIPNFKKAANKICYDG